MAALIQQMISPDPGLRPDIETIKKSAVFGEVLAEPMGAKQPKPTAVPAAEEEKRTELQGELRVKIGGGKWKRKYVRFANSTIFVYEHKSSPKAKLCYPLADCAVSGLEPVESEKQPTREKEEKKKRKAVLERKQTAPLGEKWGTEKYEKGMVCVEHAILETLYLDLNELGEEEHGPWLGSLREAVVMR